MVQLHYRWRLQVPVLQERQKEKNEVAVTKKKTKPIERVLNRECDVAMARKKGYLSCQQQCKTCHACIETTSTEKRHFSPMRRN